jgi:hypothetical protein
MGMVAVVPNSYHRIASKYISRIDDWQEAVRRAYELRSTRPSINPVKLKNKDRATNPDAEKNCNGILPELRDHRKLSVRSIIDIHAWNQARWQGVAYAQDPFKPPYLAFMFENETGARKIFEHWRERFSASDEDDNIAVSIIRELPQRSKHHYCILITSKQPDAKKDESDQTIIMATRFNIMEPDNGVNLENFLKLYDHFNVFYLLPALLKGNDSVPPEFLFDLAILKKNLTVKFAEDIGEHDIEAVALKQFHT